ncbi:VWA domain-containing protein [Bacillus sp. ISL-47]|nr:VWA domain-containing protein [Bacillus sp. ISL-47]MBT2686878.1 VWA domain-containing protein [Bacillus sp. ISL-47]
MLLSACSSDKEEVTAKTPAKEKEQQEEKQEKILTDSENISLEVTEEVLLNLPAGTLMDGLAYEKDIENVDFNTPETDSELKSKMTSKLEELTKETNDVEAIKKGLVSLLASPHYKEVLEKAKVYEPAFEEPYLPDPTKSEGGEEKEAAEKAIILLDASSSMLLQTGGQIKMDIAKDAVKSFAQTIGQSSDVSLVVYGHKGSEADAEKEISCSGVEEVYPMGQYSKKEFHEAVDSFESNGWTPLAGAIQKAAVMSSGYDGATTIYIVSDGAETCDGDPVQASKDLIQNNSSNTVNIIGFDVDGKTEDQLKAVAEAGNGEYFKADNPEELKNTIQYEWLPSALDLAWAFTMAPDGWEMMEEYDKGEVYPRQLFTIGRREAHRILDAVSIMSEQGWITEEQESELRDWGYERSEQMKDLYYDLHEKNREKANTKSAEIKQRVDEWVEKMKALKKERGDIW